jgi:undecaprenyl-diphosphatase
MDRLVGTGSRKGSNLVGRAADVAKRPPTWAAVACIMSLCGPRGRHAALRGSVAYVAAALAHLPVKALVGRPHPPRAGRIARVGPVTSSFPSGHTASELAFALTAAQEVPLLFVPLYAAAAGSAWSLLRSRSHYVSDVVAGGALAVVVATAAWKLWPPPRAAAARRRDAAGAGGPSVEASPQRPTGTGTGDPAQPAEEAAQLVR